jgi:hypothetical protein
VISAAALNKNLNPRRFYSMSLNSVHCVAVLACLLESSDFHPCPCLDLKDSPRD